MPNLIKNCLGGQIMSKTRKKPIDIKIEFANNLDTSILSKEEQNHFYTILLQNIVKIYKQKNKIK